MRKQSAHERIQDAMLAREQGMLSLVRRENRAGFGFSTGWSISQDRMQLLGLSDHRALDRLEAKGRIVYHAVRQDSDRRGYWIPALL
jgi:hypothetical protein